jgi:hypothetical protein
MATAHCVEGFVVQLLPGARLARGMVPCGLPLKNSDLQRARTLLGLDT